ncbi:MAG: dTDP-4-dehydrorhamnose 3,5-epimerase [Bacilli bacterium]|jgi:dTDP-4-dehydrorhamnose 3,5-epimerase|nr:dTDP-4-dehydrorhamnose 3,5-epimerase [Bacilli bacterium]
MNLIKTDLDGAYILEPVVHGDSRGWFIETYNAQELKRLGITTVFVQDNQSFSKEKGIIRGLHCQTNPHCQTKLIRCTRGSILDVIVDIRRGSPTYLKHIGVELTSENKRMLYIPKGFLHGFVTLSDDVEVQYKVDDYYFKENDRSVRFDDPAIGVAWPVVPKEMSQKDLSAPLLKDSDCLFDYRK